MFLLPLTAIVLMTAIYLIHQYATRELDPRAAGDATGTAQPRETAARDVRRAA
jgi:hypothetical protein